MDRYPQIPKWCIRNVLPAFYDFESLTAIEQTGALYHTIRSLIDDYNNYVNEINKMFKDFIDGINPQEEFENKITKIVHDYIKMMDTKIQHQDREIEESIVYIKNNMLESITNIINEMKENGELTEGILESFNNIGERVTALENEKTELENRITNIENSKSYVSYDESKEELTIIFDEKVGV